MTKPTPSSGTEPELEFSGSFDDYWSYTKVRDWILLRPDIGRTALHLYLLLRSMLAEKRSHSLRRMSVDQLCWLLPGINGKPIGKRTVEETLRELDRLGLVTNPDQERLVTSTGKAGITNTLRRYQVHDLPPSQYSGWRNTWDKLDAYRPDWRERPPQPPTHRSASGFGPQNSADRKHVHRAGAKSAPYEPRISARGTKKTASPAQKTTIPPQESPAVTPPTRENTAPKEAVLEKSSLSNGTLADRVAQGWARGLRAGGHSAMPRRQAAIRAQAHDLLAAGQSNPTHLVAVAVWMGRVKPGWNRLEDALTYQGPDAPIPSATQTDPTSAPGCPECDDGWCYEDPENALRPYRCPRCRP